jgi:hypothetical protein
MKSNVNPAIIAVSVVVLLGLVFLLYRFTLGGNGQPKITPDNAPNYVKQMQKGETPTSPYH